MARHQFYFAVNTKLPADEPLHLQWHPGLFRLVRFAALEQQDSHFLSILTGHRNSGCVPHSDPGMLLRNAFQILRPHLTAVDNQKVFFPAGDKNIVFSDIGQITGIQPAVIGQHTPGSIFIVEVAAHNTGPPDV